MPKIKLAVCFLWLCISAVAQAQPLNIIAPTITKGTWTGGTLAGDGTSTTPGASNLINAPTIINPAINTPTINGGTVVNLSSMTINPNPNTAASVYTSGNTSISLYNDSQDTLAQAWSDLFGSSPATHDTVSIMATSPVGANVIQTDALSTFCRNKNALSYSSALNACVANQTNVFNDVPGAASWGIAQIFNENLASSDTTTASAYLNESDFKPKRPTTNVVAWQYVLDSYVPTTGSGAGVAVQPNSAAGPECLSTNAAQWTFCFATGDGAAQYHSLVGMKSVAGAYVNSSQYIGFYTTPVSGVKHANRISAQDTYTILDRDDGGVNTLNLSNGDVDVQAGHNFNVAGLPVTQTDTVGHIVFRGVSPSVINCGTGASPRTGATDNAGTILVGSGGVTSCTLNFGNTFAAGARPIPACVATLLNSGQAIWMTNRSATTVTFSVSTPINTGVEIDYHCL